MSHAVPAIARLLLRLAAPANQRDWLVADLEEEAASRAARHGVRAARRWSTRQVMQSVAPLLAQRAESAVSAAGRMQMSVWRGLRTDVQVAWRQLAKAPAFALVCIVTLALGIGGNTAVFTLIDHMVRQPLPVSSPDELYRLGGGDNCCVSTGLEGEFSLFSYDLFEHLRDAAPEFSQLAAFQANTMTMAIARAEGDAPPESLKSSFVSGNYFEMFGLVPAAGRLLSPMDDRRDATAVAVISHRAWLERYQGKLSVIGAPVTLNGVPATIVGVAPSGFYGETLRPNPADMWVPLAMEPRIQPQSKLLDAKASHWLYAIGRLRRGVAPRSLEPGLTATLQRWIAANLELRTDDRARIKEQHIAIVPAAAGVQSMRNEIAPALRLLQAIAAVVLLIACANLANLLVTRGVSRRGETAMRVALGAPRARLVAQHLVESLLLAALGGAAGLAVAYLGAQAIVDIAFEGVSNIPVTAAPSASVLLFAIGISVLTGIVFGVAPAVIASRSNPIDALRGAGRATGDRGSRMRRSLVALQIAMSLVLLTCAGLLGRSLARLQAQDFGFRIEQRYVVNILPALGASTAPELEPLYARLRQRLTEIPGVADVAMSLYSPMSGDNWSSLLTVDGRDAGERIVASWDRITPGYFETIGTPVVRGRGISDRDRPGSALVTVVNQTFARRYFGDADPIGRRIGFTGPKGGGVREFEIVGVVGDAKYQDAKGPAYPTFFLPFLQTTAASRIGGDGDGLDRSHYPRAVELHVTAPVPGLEREVRTALAEVDRRVTVLDVLTMEQQVAGNFNLERLTARLTVAFGSVALLLACLGLYGVTAYGVSRRTREIGIRMAIGATREGVLRSVLRGALLQVAAGVAIGVPAALVAGRYLQSQLFGVSTHDPLTLGGAVLVLLLCAVAAALIPARRAASLDPIRALRIE